MALTRNKRDTTKLMDKPEFHIRIHSCQNSSVQGELHWLNSGKKINFRSLYELIMLVQGAMDESLLPEGKSVFRSWDKANNCRIGSKERACSSRNLPS